MDERVQQARELYEHLVFTGDATALTEADRTLDGVEADLAMARGRVMHGRFLLRRDHDTTHPLPDPDELSTFERAAQLYQSCGDTSGEAEANFWIGCFYQVVQHNNDEALPALARSLDLASQAGDKVTMSEALRHLGIAAHTGGRLDEARLCLEQSTSLRRELKNLAGVSANLIGLAYVAAGEGRRSDAEVLLDEAMELAQATGAARILQSIIEARADLVAPDESME
ncbi:MAG: tetratricopeptide repeat protein [Acidimicrobiales bacterium]